MDMIKGRIIEARRTNFIVTTDKGDFTATVRGNFHAAGDFPKVGDYVSLEVLDMEKAVIESVLPRASVIKRKAVDSDEEQIIATNVDLVFIVMGLDGDFNISRLERYLLLVEQSGIKPVVVLNKSDLLEDDNSMLNQVEQLTGNVPVLVVSALVGDGMDELASYIKNGDTAVLLGSSGAGKSTITNWLLGENKQAVNEIRLDDSRGRHTTTTRHLFTVPSGGYLIDTPGMRELGIVEAEGDDEQLVFERIQQYSTECKFSNCDHDKSDGCAVLAAIENGDLTERELANYHKLLRERRFHEDKSANAAVAFHDQNQKRQQMKESALKRKRLSRGLR